MFRCDNSFAAVAPPGPLPTMIKSLSIFISYPVNFAGSLKMYVNGVFSIAFSLLLLILDNQLFSFIGK